MDSGFFSADRRDVTRKQALDIAAYSYIKDPKNADIHFCSLMMCALFFFFLLRHMHGLPQAHTYCSLDDRNDMTRKHRSGTATYGFFAQ